MRSRFPAFLFLNACLVLAASSATPRSPPARTNSQFSIPHGPTSKRLPEEASAHGKYRIAAPAHSLPRGRALVPPLQRLRHVHRHVMAQLHEPAAGLLGLRLP